MKFPSKYTVVVHAKSTEIHAGKKRRAIHLYSYWVDDRQVDYYSINSSNGLTSLDRERAGIEAYHHVKSLGESVTPLERVRRGHKKPTPLVPDKDGNRQKKLL